jgi:hypothetical protein
VPGTGTAPVPSGHDDNNHNADDDDNHNDTEGPGH